MGHPGPHEDSLGVTPVHRRFDNPHQREAMPLSSRTVSTHGRALPPVTSSGARTSQSPSGSAEKKWRTTASAARVFDASEEHPSAASISHPIHLTGAGCRDMTQ